MITFEYNGSTRYILRFRYTNASVRYYRNGHPLEGIRTCTTVELVEDGPDLQAVLDRASVTHNPVDPPSLESARRQALTKLLKHQPDRGFRAAVWAAYFLSREARKQARVKALAQTPNPNLQASST